MKTKVAFLSLMFAAVLFAVNPALSQAEDSQDTQAYTADTSSTSTDPFATSSSGTDMLTPPAEPGAEVAPSDATSEVTTSKQTTTETETTTTQPNKKKKQSKKKRQYVK